MNSSHYWSMLFVMNGLMYIFNFIEKLGIQNERQALQLALDEFEKEGLDAGNKMFISGLSSPNMADIVIFGTLRSIEHLSSFKDTVNQRNSDTTKQWYKRMHAELKTGEM